MRNHFFFVFFFVTLSFFAHTQSLKGRVKDAETQDAIAFARVTLVDFQNTVQTNEVGMFEIIGTYPNRCKLRVSASGYESWTMEVAMDSMLNIQLIPMHLELNEVSVTASGNELKRNSVSYVELKSVEELNELPKTSLGELLESIPGVYNSSTGLGISKPVIRGLQGVRVLTLLNGVRMEGQQWGGDHGMGVSELGIETIEVLKGPASLQYGADALGGVLYLSNEHSVNQNSHRITLSSQFETASMSLNNMVLYNGATKNVKILAGGRFASFADYQLPNGMYVKNSRFQEGNAKFSIGWHKNKWISNIRYDWSKTTVGIPGHSHDTIPQYIDFVSNNQLRKKELPFQYLDNHLLSWENKFVLTKQVVQLTTAVGINQLYEYEEKYTIPELSIRTLSTPYRLNISASLFENWTINYGLQGMFLSQFNGNNAMSRIVPDANQIDQGAYAIVQWNKNKIKFQGGVRGDYRYLNALKDNKFVQPFSKSYCGINFSTGINYSFSKNHLMRVNISTGFRTPHLSELLSNGVHHGTFRYEIGNHQLKSEKAHQLDVSYEFSGDHLSLIVNPFVNLLSNYIYLQPTDSIAEQFPVFEYKQASFNVLQFGSDVGLHWHPHFAHVLHVESTLSLLAMHAKNHAVYSFIPQTRWSNSIVARFNMKSKVKIDNIVLSYSYYLPQNQVSIYEHTSSDYGVLDLGIQTSFALKTPIQLQLGIKNVTNEKYMNHLSRLKTIGLESPGRNFYIKLILSIYAKKNN